MANLHDGALASKSPTIEHSQTQQNTRVIRERLRNGQCPNCGQQCFRMKGVLRKRKAISREGLVSNGRCLRCNPLDLTGGSFDVIHDHHHHNNHHQRLEDDSNATTGTSATGNDQQSTLNVDAFSQTGTTSTSTATTPITAASTAIEEEHEKYNDLHGQVQLGLQVQSSDDTSIMTLLTQIEQSRRELENAKEGHQDRQNKANILSDLVCQLSHRVSNLDAFSRQIIDQTDTLDLELCAVKLALNQVQDRNESSKLAMNMLSRVVVELKEKQLQILEEHHKTKQQQDLWNRNIEKKIEKHDDEIQALRDEVNSLASRAVEDVLSCVGSILDLKGDETDHESQQHEDENDHAMAYIKTHRQRQQHHDLLRNSEIHILDSSQESCSALEEGSLSLNSQLFKGDGSVAASSKLSSSVVSHSIGSHQDDDSSSTWWDPEDSCRINPDHLMRDTSGAGTRASSMGSLVSMLDNSVANKRHVSDPDLEPPELYNTANVPDLYCNIEQIQTMYSTPEAREPYTIPEAPEVQSQAGSFDSGDENKNKHLDSSQSSSTPHHVTDKQAPVWATGVVIGTNTHRRRSIGSNGSYVPPVTRKASIGSNTSSMAVIQPVTAYRRSSNESDYRRSSLDHSITSIGPAVSDADVDPIFVEEGSQDMLDNDYDEELNDSSQSETVLPRHEAPIEGLVGDAENGTFVKANSEGDTVTDITASSDAQDENGTKETEKNVTKVEKPDSTEIADNANNADDSSNRTPTKVVRFKDQHLSECNLVLAKLTTATGKEEARKSLEEVGNIAREPDNRKALGRKINAISVVLQLMNRFKDHSDVLEMGCRALSNLACGNLANQESIARKNGIVFILQAMRDFHDNASIQQRACYALGNLALNNPPNQEQLVEKNGVITILQAMQNFPLDAQVQHRACFALGKVVRNGHNFQQKVRSYGGLDLIKTALENHPLNSRVQKLGTSLLKVLKPRERRGSMTKTTKELYRIRD